MKIGRASAIAPAADNARAAPAAGRPARLKKSKLIAITLLHSGFMFCFPTFEHIDIGMS
jgi:hypothetical protein